MSNLKIATNSSINDKLYNYKELNKKRAMVESNYEVYLKHLTETDPKLKELSANLDTLAGQMEALEAELKQAARASQVSLKSHGVSVSYSNPQVVSHDVDKLLEKYPEAEDIPRLLVKSVDTEVLQAAVAAGLVDEDVEEHCRVETPRYRQGRVQVKVLKD